MQLQRVPTKQRVCGLHGGQPDGSRTADSGDYQPRNAISTVLHRVVRDNLETFLEQVATRSSGNGLPRFVERGFRQFIPCGVLAEGFARFQCNDCPQERLVPLSCKIRGLCPSCDGRRMAERAANLVDKVIAPVPMRQWVITFPHGLRYLLAWDHKLCCAVLRVFIRAVQSLQLRRAKRAGITNGKCGAIAVIQRFASGLRLNVHVHTLVPDGVFYLDHGRTEFQQLEPPTDQDVAKLVATVRKRVLRLLERRGLAQPTRVEVEDDPIRQREPALAALLGTAVRGARTFGPYAGAPVATIGRDPRAPWTYSKGPLQAHVEGFDLHAAVCVEGHDTQGLERLCRYLLRPAVVQDRLSHREDGKVLVELKRAWNDGTHHLLFEPLDVLARLATFIPKPRSNLIIYYGVFSPHSAWRRAVVGYRPQSPSTPLSGVKGFDGPICLIPAVSEPDLPTPDGVARAMSKRSPTPTPTLEQALPRRGSSNDSWSQLMMRAFQLDVLKCPKCHGRMRLVAVVMSRTVAAKILRHLGRDATRPRPKPARPPPDEYWS